MSLPTPPRYVVVPEVAIDQAFAPDKPRRALLGSFVRILSLAWEAKYQHTPLLNEEELIEFLKLSRRQYFEQKADMELLGWLRSSYPRTGFVQFTFSRLVAEKTADQIDGAENPQVDAKNRTDELKRNQEDDLKFKNESSSSSSLKQSEVRKTALTDSEARMQRLLENLHLLFDPQVHGVLDVRDVLLAGIPDRVLGWIAKAYHEHEKLSAPIGLIVKHVIDGDETNRYYVENYLRILPEEYLEAVQEISYSCEYCDQVFPQRVLLTEHVGSCHHVCMECGQAFDSQDAEKAHYDARHDPNRAALKTDSQDRIKAPALDGTISAAWLNVLRLLQDEMPRASFDTWMRDTEIVRYDGNAVEIGTRNAYARDWLTSRYTLKVKQLVSQVLGRDVDVTFVVTTAVVVEEEA